MIVCLFAFDVPLKILHDIEMSARSGDVGRALQGPDNLICENVVREEGHEVVCDTNHIETSGQKEGQHDPLEMAIAANKILEKMTEKMTE